MQVCLLHAHTALNAGKESSCAKELPASLRTADDRNCTGLNHSTHAAPRTLHHTTRLTPFISWNIPSGMVAFAGANAQTGLHRC